MCGLIEMSRDIRILQIMRVPALSSQENESSSPACNSYVVCFLRLPCRHGLGPAPPTCVPELYVLGTRAVARVGWLGGYEPTADCVECTFGLMSVPPEGARTARSIAMRRSAATMM